jgi:hypothetical protein
MNEPIAERKALLLSWLFIISPANAPIKGPIINPKGGKKKIPMISPMVAPRTPLFVPPDFLVAQIGM